MRQTIERIAQSEWLLAVNRILVMLVSTVGFPILFWTVSTVVSVDRKQALLEAENARQSADIVALQRGREADLTSLALLGQQLGKLGEKIDGQRYSLNRIEAFIDRQTTSRP